MTESDKDKTDSESVVDSVSVPEALGGALSGAAKKLGLGDTQTGSAAQATWGAMGGWFGIAETVLPSLVFVVVYTLTLAPVSGSTDGATEGNLPWSLGLSVGLALFFTLLRILRKSSPNAAIGGLIATVASAILALMTGKGSDNFVLGFFTNGIYGSAFLISVLVGWPLLGLAVGYLMGDGTRWRQDRRKRWMFSTLSLLWAALFAIRLFVQLPLYFADDTTMLGTLKIAMGIPLFAPMVALSWLWIRACYRNNPKPSPNPEPTPAAPSEGIK